MPKQVEIRLHAKKQLKERKIPEDLIRKVLLHPGQVIDSYSDRKIAQAIVKYKGERFLVRVVYEETERELKVVTVYLTTKTEKYWRKKNAY